MGKLIYEHESYEVRGALFEVYRDKGQGFLEAVYHECIAVEFELRNIPFVSKPPIRLSYKGRQLNQVYVPDFVCYGKILIELKAVKALADDHRAQVINYLRATEIRLGLLVNFGATPELQIERFFGARPPEAEHEE